MKLHNLSWQRSVRLRGGKMARKIQNVMNDDDDDDDDTKEHIKNYSNGCVEFSIR